MEIKILLIEDDKEDYLMIKKLLSRIETSRYRLEWIKTYPTALESLGEKSYDLVLLDYRLGEHNGLDLLKEAINRGLEAPIIFLTGTGDHLLDLEAMKHGAADYLDKNELSAPLLERSLRYAIEHKRIEKELKHLSAMLLTAQEQERKRIARELHDSISQTLAAVKYGAETALRQLDRKSNPAAGKILESFIPLTQGMIEEVRRIYMGLRPTILDELGVIAAVDWWLREFKAGHPELDIDQKIEVVEEDIPDSLKLALFRVMQQALDNVACHSRAKHVVFFLHRSGGNLELAISDDGIGFNPGRRQASQGPPKGLGLASMKERIELSGGSLSVESAKGKGTTIRAVWPKT